MSSVTSYIDMKLQINYIQQPQLGSMKELREKKRERDGKLWLLQQINYIKSNNYLQRNCYKLS